MASDAPLDPLFASNRRKIKEIINNYSNPNQEPTFISTTSPPVEKVTAALREKIVHHEKECREAAQKWETFNLKNGSKINEKGEFAKIREKASFVELVFKGIPEAFRCKFWIYLLDIADLGQKKADMYNEIKEKSKRFARLEDVFQIDKDVQRTFRDRAEFKKDYSQRQCMLFNVLVAYSFYNEELGYCQGMHQCAGLLLLYLPNEQSAFWGLHELMTGNKYRLHGLFINHFPKYIRLREKFENLLQKKNKQLYNHLDECFAVTDTYLMLWYFTVFQADFPLSLSLRIWDIFLLKGDEIFIPMAYTLITFKEKELKRDDSPKLYITNFKQTLLYEESNIVEAFKKNRKLMETQGRLRNKYIDEIPNDEIPAEFGELLKKEDLISNGYDDPDIEITSEINEKENESLINKVKGFAENTTHRMSYYATYSSPSTSPIPSQASNITPLTAIRNNCRPDEVDEQVLGLNTSSQNSLEPPFEPSLHSPENSTDVMHENLSPLPNHYMDSKDSSMSDVSNDYFKSGQSYNSIDRRSISKASSPSPIMDSKSELRSRPNVEPRLLKSNSPGGAIASLPRTLGARKKHSHGECRTRNDSQSNSNCDYSERVLDRAISNEDSVGRNVLNKERQFLPHSSNTQRAGTPRSTSSIGTSTSIPSLPQSQTLTPLNNYDVSCFRECHTSARIGSAVSSRKSNRSSMSPISPPLNYDNKHRNAPRNVPRDRESRRQSKSPTYSNTFLMCQGLTEKYIRNSYSNGQRCSTNMTIDRRSITSPDRGSFTTKATNRLSDIDNQRLINMAHNDKLETEFSVNTAAAAITQSSACSSNGTWAEDNKQHLLNSSDVKRSGTGAGDAACTSAANNYNTISSSNELSPNQSSPRLDVSVWF